MILSPWFAYLMGRCCCQGNDGNLRICQTRYAVCEGSEMISRLSTKPTNPSHIIFR